MWNSQTPVDTFILHGAMWSVQNDHIAIRPRTDVVWKCSCWRHFHVDVIFVLTLFSCWRHFRVLVIFVLTSFSCYCHFRVTSFSCWRNFRQSATWCIWFSLLLFQQSAHFFFILGLDLQPDTKFFHSSSSPPGLSHWRFCDVSCNAAAQ